MGAAGSGIEVTANAAQADYVLVGRVVAERIEYTWVLPGADLTAQPGLPLRSAWESADSAGFAESLGESARQLARLKAWQLLATPAGGNVRFPYHLQLQELTSKQYLAPGATVRGGESYRPVLVAAESPAQVQPRYVYLFSLAADGSSSLHVPGAGITVGENLLPDKRDPGPAPAVIPLGRGFAVSPPFGREVLILLTSVTALPDPAALVFSPLHRGPPRSAPCAHPLECLILGINTSSRRSVASTTASGAPADWSIERLIINSTEH
jgi:hypothetical protein